MSSLQRFLITIQALPEATKKHRLFAGELVCLDFHEKQNNKLFFNFTTALPRECDNPYSNHNLECLIALWKLSGCLSEGTYSPMRTFVSMISYYKSLNLMYTKSHHSLSKNFS